MVGGLARFKEHFADYTDQYVLIGGAASTIAMEKAGLEFRATKDLDIVLCAEALNAEFGNAFWRFVLDGKYQIQEISSGERPLYRFQRPADNAYPFMLELFSRVPDVLTLAPGSHLTPIPFEEGASSLSAILMDNEYYTFLQSGKRVVDGVQIAGAEQLIPLKARAWLDLTERVRQGDPVDSKVVRKHKNDVFRLSQIVDADHIGSPPQAVKTDLTDFLLAMQADAVDLKSLGLGSLTLEGVSDELRRVYDLE